VRPLRLAQPVRPRARETRRGHHRDRVLIGQHLELTPLGCSRLVDVAGEDELGAGLRELLEHAAATGERPLARSPGGIGKLVVEADDAQRARRRAGEALGCPLESTCPQAARLVSPRPDGVDPDHVQPAGRVHRLCRLPLALELLPWARKPRRRQQRDVVVARNGQHGRRQAVQQRRDTLVLITPPAVREVARGDHEIGLNAVDEGPQGALDKGLLAGSDMNVGDVDQARRHSRGRLYTGLVTDESTESTEIFDDLYLGLRAGGAIRKQRRGEPLTMEEEAALGHWQRLSNWRKVIAVGAFALGTFGLGFTIGGIVFGRRRNA
jgi:hypothetical protein